jgi:hypothetical protein
LFQKKKTFVDPFSEVEVGFDDNEIWALWPSKEKRSLAWSDLIGVAVETTDEGPFTEDVFWHLGGKNGVLTYPSSAKCADQLLERLQKLPEFNNERLIEAMTCAENKTFIIWDHQGRQK